MTTYRLSVLFTGVDLMDDDILDMLDTVDNTAWASFNGATQVVATIKAVSAFAAAEQLAKDVRAVIPAARPIRLDRELVSVSDIGDRTGVSRETVRLWSTGKRGGGGFPMPEGIVGDGIRVWEWAGVNTWLEDHRSLGDGYTYPSREEAMAIDAYFMTAEVPIERPDRLWHVAALPPETLRSHQKRIAVFLDGNGFAASAHRHDRVGRWVKADEEHHRIPVKHLVRA